MGEDPSRKPAMQVIVLGSGGGPIESNTTAFLVRSTAEEWHRGSVIAVDAGVHLSAIQRLIEAALPSPPPSLPHVLTEGPFAGLSLPYSSAGANAVHVTRHLVDTFLITHPHLDHISGFVVNTAGFPGTKPKRLAGLPNTISAFKTHIFNNVIWPNLSDENNGAGLVTYLRLVEGGSPAMGEGEEKGYSEVCDGLQVKIWGVSHGHCMEKHSHRGSVSCNSRRGSYDMSQSMPRRETYGQQQPQMGTSMSRTASMLGAPPMGCGSPMSDQERICVYDSSAYFIQEQTHRREILIFGDVEPDSLSLSPRNFQIWQDAAPKIASGNLAAIFIECSYDDSQSDDRLFGHLKPVFLIEELKALAAEVESAHRLRNMDSKKRKRMLSNADTAPRRNPSFNLQHPIDDDNVSPTTVKEPVDLTHNSGMSTPHLATPTRELSLREINHHFAPTSVAKQQLKGLKVVIIHVKDRLMDGPDMGETILEQLQAHEVEAQLGCEFVISKPGQSFYL